MRFQSCPPGCEWLAELASFVRQFPLPQESHVQHTRDKQHVWFWQKRKRKKDNSSKDKQVRNNDDERWSLYTKKAPTLRQSWFGCSICSSSLQWWMLTPKPHDAMVPKWGVIVKNHGTQLSFLPPWPPARRVSCSFLQQRTFSPISLVTFQHHCDCLAWETDFTEVHNSWN